MRKEKHENKQITREAYQRNRSTVTRASCLNYKSIYPSLSTTKVVFTFYDRETSATMS